MTKFLVCAYSQMGHDCLAFLLRSGYPVAAVFTHPDSSDEIQWFDSVARLAKNYKIPVYTESLTENFVTSIKVDCLLSFYYRNLIPGNLLDLFPKGCFNMHGSLLPRYRGRCPVNWAIIHGEKETGVTLHHMTKKADAGDIVDQQAVPIGFHDTAGDVMKRMIKAAQEVLKRQMPLISLGQAPRIPQNSSLATYFGGRSYQDSRIHWDQTSYQIHNLIRALQPHYPAAWSLYQEKTLCFQSSKPFLEDHSYNPGTILDVNPLTVVCGQGTIQLTLTSEVLLKVGEVLF